MLALIGMPSFGPSDSRATSPASLVTGFYPAPRSATIRGLELLVRPRTAHAGRPSTDSATATRNGLVVTPRSPRRNTQPAIRNRTCEDWLRLASGSRQHEQGQE